MHIVSGIHFSGFSFFLIITDPIGKFGRARPADGAETTKGTCSTLPELPRYSKSYLLRDPLASHLASVASSSLMMVDVTIDEAPYIGSTAPSKAASFGAEARRNKYVKG